MRSYMTEETLKRIMLLEEKITVLLEGLRDIAEAKDIFFDPNNGLYFRDLVNKARQVITNAEGKE